MNRVASIDMVAPSPQGHNTTPPSKRLARSASSTREYMGSARVHSCEERVKVAEEQPRVVPDHPVRVAYVLYVLLLNEVVRRFAPSCARWPRD